MENDIQKISFTCIACNSARINFSFQKKNFNLYKCKNCGLIFVWPIPSDFLNIYSENYFQGSKHSFGYVDYERDKAPMSATFISYLEGIEKILPNKGNLLDIGAATGYFMNLANNRGWKTSGIEISEYAASKAKEKKLDVKVGTIESVDFPEDFFDVVTLWDVLEHLSNPRKSLEIIYKILKPGGILTINTPDTSSLFAKLLGSHWHLIVPPEHLYYFNPRNLSLLLSDTGFKVVEIKKIGKRFTLNYILQTLYRWQHLSLWSFLIKKIHSSKFGDYGIPINLRDNFVVFAKKQ